MIHTASLVHDDILDHAETRRGKESVNMKWGNKRSAMAGDYILAVGSRILARIGNQEVLIVLSQVGIVVVLVVVVVGACKKDFTNKRGAFLPPPLSG